MKPVLLSALLCLLTAAPLCSQEYGAPDYDVRKTRWGMSREEVLASESAVPMYRDAEHLYYGVIETGLEALCIYTFGDDGLERVSYRFSADHPVAGLNRFLDDFRSIEADLRRRFGTPQRENVVWKEPCLRDLPSEHGFAVSIGHLAFDSLYADERTWAVHVLEGEQHAVVHGMLFQPRTGTAPPEAP